MSYLWYKYPKQQFTFENSVSLQKFLAENYEFSSKKSGVHSMKREGALFYPHQELAALFLYIWGSLLAFHGVGTGKTYVAFAIAWKLLNSNQKNPAIAYLEGNVHQVDRVVFVFHSTELMSSIKKELNKFLARVYGTNEEKIKNIKDKFSFEMAMQLTNKIKNKSNSDLKRDYSNTFFIFDEIHNYRKTDQKKDIYVQLIRLLDQVENVKILGNTGTPAVNKVSDIIYAINPLLPKGMRYEENEERFIKSIRETPQELEEYFYNYISHFRSRIEHVKIKYIGVQIDKYHRVPLIVMAPEQEEIYLSLMRKKSLNEKSALTNRGYSNAVMGELGQGTQDELYRKHVGTKDRVNVSSEYKQLLREEDYRKAYMAKFDYIGRVLIKNSADKPYVNHVYQELVDVVGGVIHLTTVLEYGFGFVNVVKHLDDITITDKTIQISRDSVYQEGLQQHKRFYALVTGDIPTIKDRDRIFKLLRHPLNKYGKYISVILTTSALKEGINILNVKKSILVDRGWHEAGDEQAFGRSYREGGFDDILKDEKPHILERYSPTVVTSADYKIIKENMKDLETAAEKNEKRVQDFQSINISSMYHSQRKDMNNKKGERLMKVMAVDGLIYKERNQDVEAEDFTPESDYAKSSYELFQELERDEPTKTYRRTFNRIHSGEIVQEFIYYLEDTFTVTNRIKIADIYKEITELNPEIFEKAMFKINKEKIFFRNNIGFLGYIAEYLDELIFVRNEFTAPSFQAVTTVSSFYYQENIAYVSTSPMARAKEKLYTTGSVYNFEQAEQDHLTYEEAITEIYGKTNFSVIQTFEYLYLEEELGARLTNYEEKFLNRFKNVYLRLQEPLGEYKIIEFKETSAKPGRKTNVFKGEIKKLRQKVGSEVGDFVTVHAIRNDGLGGMFTFGKEDKHRSEQILQSVRILKQNNSGELEWSSIIENTADKKKNKYQKAVASYYFEKIIDEKLTPFRIKLVEKNINLTKYFALITVSENKFKIWDLTNQAMRDNILRGSVIDGRDAPKGTDCNNTKHRKNNLELVVETFIRNFPSDIVFPYNPNKSLTVGKRYKNYNDFRENFDHGKGKKIKITDDEIDLFVGIANNKSEQFCTLLREVLVQNGFFLYV